MVRPSSPWPWIGQLALLAGWSREACGEQPLPLDTGGYELDEAGVVKIFSQFAQLWNYVVVNGGQQGRGAQSTQAAHLGQHACFWGLTNLNYGLAQRWLLELYPAIETVEFVDAPPATMGQADYISELSRDFGHHRFVATTGSDSSDLGKRSCDIAVVSKDSLTFTIEKLVARAGERVAVAWVSAGCIAVDGDSATHSCGFLNMFWVNTVLMRRGTCLQDVCLSYVPAADLVDPNTFPLLCADLLGANGLDAARHWTSPAAEFSQDWFVNWNFFSRPWDKRGPSGASSGGDMLYVDIGANFPYEYSNTVVLERCFNWSGVCVEPNRGLEPWLSNYRNCRLHINCVSAANAADKIFRGRDGGEAFKAECVSTDALMERAELVGKKVDVLSVDVENSELAVLETLSWHLHRVDVRTLIVEVGRGVRWLEVETIMLQHGYVKVAVLGRDVVYVKSSMLLNDVPPAAEEWQQYDKSFIPGALVGAGDAHAWLPMESAKRMCEAAGDACAGITCMHIAPGDGGEGLCSMRSGPGLYVSPQSEVSHVKRQFSADVPLYPFLARGRASPLLPPGWAEFHQRVVDEEQALERQQEQELWRQGKRRN